MNLADKTFTVEYEAEMDRGYGVEGMSGYVCLSFDKDGDLSESTLMGMHDRTEYEFETNIDLTHEEAIKILKEAKVL